MAFLPSAQANGTKYGTGNLPSSAASVASGDLIVVQVGVAGGSAAVYPDSVTDTASNTYVARSLITTAYSSLLSYYCIGATGNGSNVATANFSAHDGSQRKNIIVGVYTPDSGDTVTLDIGMTKTTGWENSPWETAQGTTTGTDEVCQAFFQTSGSKTWSNREIPSGTGATTLTSPDGSCAGMYTIFASTQTNIEAEIDVTAGGHYAAEMLCFKSVGGGVTGNPWYHYARSNRGQ